MLLPEKVLFSDGAPLLQELEKQKARQHQMEMTPMHQIQSKKERKKRLGEVPLWHTGNKSDSYP